MSRKSGELLQRQPKVLTLNLGLESGKQALDLVVDLRRIFQRRCDLSPEYVAIAAAETMHGHPDRSLGHPQLARRGRVRRRARPFCEKNLKRFKSLGPARVLVFTPQLAENPAQQRERPGPVENPLRSQLVRKLASVTSLRTSRVNRYRRPARRLA